MGFKLSAACGCNIGRRRRNNEDNFYFDGKILPEVNSGVDHILTAESKIGKQTVNYAVFDGMGGHADGQIASHMAAEIYAGELAGADQNHRANLKETVSRMSESIWRRAEENFSNMGTTAAILRFAGDRYYLANVGDSRVFLYRNSRLEQISHDHTDEELMQQVGISGRKPRLTQYVGISEEELVIEPFLKTDFILPSDQFLVCSDGLTDMVSPEEISSVLGADSKASDETEALIRLALEHGGKDNITVILIKVLPA